MNEESSDSILYPKTKKNKINQARQTPRKFAYLNDSELTCPELARKRLYIRLLKSAEDIRDENNLGSKYNLVSMKKIIKILETHSEKFNENCRIVFENIDREGSGSLKNTLMQINPFAIEYTAQGEDDPFAIFIEAQKHLYEMQLAMIFDGTLDLSEEENMNNLPSLEKSYNGISDEDFAFRMQLDELHVDSDYSRFQHLPIIDSGDDQIALDAGYAMMLHRQLNERE